MRARIKFDRRQKKLFETLLFLLKLLAFAIPLWAILSFQNVLMPLQGMVSQNVQALLQALGFAVSKDGFLIKADGIIFFISEDCTGWKSMLLLAALVCAVPRAGVKKRLWGLAAGIPVLYAGNLARILLMILVWNAYGFELAMTLHNYLWQAGLITLVLALWVAWLCWAGKLGKTLLKRPHKLIKPKGRKKKAKGIKHGKR